LSDLQAFRDALARADRPTDFYRWRLQITQVATPDEVVQLHESRPLLPRPDQDWLDELVGRLTREFPTVRGFTREDLSSAGSLYRSTADSTTASRTLLVAFASKGHRMLVETSVFLQHLPEGRYDVLMLRDEQRQGFREGLPDMAQDLPSLCEMIRSTVAIDYDRMQTMGASMGGFSALLAAGLLGAERGISVGGGVPAVLEAAAGATASRDRGGHGPLLLCVFADGHARDRRRAEEIAERIPDVALVEVTGAAEHTLLNTARHRSALGRLLEYLLIDADGALAAVPGGTPPGARVRFSLPPTGASSSDARSRRLDMRRSSRLDAALGPLLRAFARMALPAALKDRVLRTAYWRLGLVIQERPARRSGRSSNR
jgi:dienelactone hydrolase